MKLFGTFLLFVFGLTGEAQNLVPNPSFEKYSNCPNAGGEIYFAIPWVDPSSGSSDYYNACSSNFQSSVPTNLSGHRWPRTGKAYAGIATYASTIPQAREYIQVKLNDTLVTGKLYCVGFYVSFSEVAEFASNGFSAYFSLSPISCSACLLPYIPQINYLGSPITDTAKWTLISGTFIANGGEQYITIGNFNSDANTISSLVNPSGSGGPAAYYYIDDVYVGSCDTTKSPIVKSALLAPNIFTPNNDGQNDVFKIQGTNLQTLNCKIYDRWGGKVWELNNPDESWDGHNQTGIPCNDGVYFYVLEAVGEEGKTYHQTGFVQLVR
jgi:gliding motility-associated-like protein